jgi:CBS domain containing-hemolysin-like protein
MKSIIRAIKKSKYYYFLNEIEYDAMLPRATFSIIDVHRKHEKYLKQLKDEGFEQIITYDGYLKTQTQL